MTTLNQATASRDAYQVLQKTIEANVLEELQGPLARIVHSAIRKGVVAASQTPAANEASEPASDASATRPVAGGLCAKVWDMLDKAVAEKGEVPTLQEVQKLAKRRRWNANTARVQYYRWRSAQPAQPAANAS